MYTIYTDGACSDNPGPGGYGYLIFQKDTEIARGSAGYRLTTNNRMELRGVITALDTLPSGADATVVTDSKYIVDAIRLNWLTNWIAKGWRNAQKKPVANRDLWEKLKAHLDDKRVSFTWIRGHAGHRENEMCDQLAVAAATQPQATDEGYVYEKSQLFN